MNVKDVIEKLEYRIVAGEEGLQKDITSVYCCDLLSFAMGKAPADCAWVTVMGNINAVAVASLADIACIVLADGVIPDEAARKKAQEEGIPILLSDGPIFETGKQIDDLL